MTREEILRGLSAMYRNADEVTRLRMWRDLEHLRIERALQRHQSGRTPHHRT